MRAGDLRTPLAIEQPVVVEPDAVGFINRRTDDAWETIAEPWGDITGLSGSEIERRGMIDNTASHRIEIRYMEGLTAKMRVRNGEEKYSINSIIDPDRRKERLFLFCTQRL